MTLPKVIYVNKDTQKATPLLFPVLCLPKDQCAKYVLVSEDVSSAYPTVQEEVEGLSLEAKEIVRQVLRDLRQARTNWPPFNSAHEGFAVLKEEVDELWDHVKTNQKRRELLKMESEAVQVAAMGLRFAIEVCNEVTGRK